MFKPKTSGQDYTPSMLPQTRRELFRDVVKLHWGQFLMCGCLMLAFSFPIHALALAGDLYAMDLQSALAQADPAQLPQLLPQAALAELRFALIRDGLDIPLLVFWSVGLSGLARIVRQYAWGENVNFTYDFALGVRQNGRQFAAFALLGGAVWFVCAVVLRFNEISAVLGMGGGSSAPREIYEWLQIVPAALAVLLLLPMAAYALVACSCYENTLAQNLKIGRVCYFRWLWGTLLALGCCLAPLIPQTLSGFSAAAVLLCHFLGRAISTLLLPFLLLGWYLFALGKLDEVVNQKLHPELVGKGLYRPGDGARDE